METLRAKRARGEVWDPHFFERDPRFWPIARAAQRFSQRADWPEPEELPSLDAAALGALGASLRFVTAPKPRRQRRASLDVDRMYDARVLGGEVPTRPRSWHDFLNALVWLTFPRAKRALHERQGAIVRAWIPEGATTLPNARTREHDALALIDEGGVVLLASDRDELVVPFGHALFEGLVLGTRAMIARAVRLPVDAIPREPLALAIDAADALLAARLRAPIVPEELPRFVFERREP